MTGTSGTSGAMTTASEGTRGIVISNIAVEGLHREHKTEETSSQNPYISFVLGTQKEKTASTKHGKASCSWEETLHFKPTDAEVLAVSAIHHRTLAADHIIGHVMVRMDQLHEGRNEFVLKSKSHADTGVVSFSVAGLEWSQPREGTFTVLPNRQTVSTRAAQGGEDGSAAQLQPIKNTNVQHNLGDVPTVDRISEPQPRTVPSGASSEIPAQASEPAGSTETQEPVSSSKPEEFQYITHKGADEPLITVPHYRHAEGGSDVEPFVAAAAPVPASATPALGSAATQGTTAAQDK